MKSNKFKSYIILCASVLISAVIGYYLNKYFNSLIITLLATCTLAIVLSQLLELSIAQLRNRREPADESIYSKETIETIKKFEEKLKVINPTAQLYILHWQSKQFISLSGGDAFSAQHSLVYASQKHPQIINSQDVSCLEHLPEVMSLDIQAFLKSKGVSSALPLHTDKTVFGFILMNIKDEQQSHEITDCVEHSSQTLGHLLQQDAIIGGSNILSSQLNKIKKDAVPWQSKVVLIYFIIMTIYLLVTPYIAQVMQKRVFFEFGNAYGLVAAWGGIWALIISKQYVKQKNLSRALLFFGAGLILQEFGQLSYAAYYYLWGIQIPYPSIGDIGYFGSAITYIIGVYFLSKACGINLKLRLFQNQLIALIVPILMLLLGYLLFLQHYQFEWNNPLKIFLDFGYPLVQAIYVSIAILVYLLSRDIKGTIKKYIIFIVAALIWQFICDYTFLYQASRGTWEANGLNDYMYLVSYVWLGTVLASFTRIKIKRL